MITIRTKLSFVFGLFFSLTSLGQFGFEYNDSIIVKTGGDTLNLAWSGGLNYAQFSDFDYDFDGDLDLFIFDRSQSNIRVFTQEGTGSNKHYQLAYNAHESFPNDLRYRATMVDFDNDGRKDIFTYGIGGLKVYRNTGSLANGPSWELFQDLVYSQYPGGTFNLYVSSSDIPAIADIDLDGDIDILTFHQGGRTLEYHQNQSMELYGIPDSLEFVLKNECWGKFSEDATTNGIVLNDPNYPCVGGNIANPETIQNDNEGSRNHAGSTVLAIDIDNSGVMDLVIGDVAYTNMTLLINSGTAVNTDSPILTVDNFFPSNTNPIEIQLFPAAFFLDVDFDGVKDLIACPNAKNVSANKNSIHFYKNIGTNANPTFVFISDNFLQSEMIEHGSGSIPVLVDYNEDGLDDLLVSSFYRFKPPSDKESSIAYYQNTGTAADPVFSYVDEDVFNLIPELYGLRLVPTFGDLDNDGDQDLLIGREDGYLVYYENISSGSGMVLGASFPNYPDHTGNPILVSGYAHPQLFDLDKDSLLDILIGTQTGEIHFYKNVGTAALPEFELHNSLLGNVDVSTVTPDGYAAPHFFRINDTTHLFLGSVDGELYYYNAIDGNLNPGDSFNLVSSSYLGIDVEAFSSFFVKDIDNDGNLNLFIGQDLGGLYHFEAVPGSNASINETNLETHVHVFPNPVNNEVTINAELPIEYVTLKTMNGSTLVHASIHAAHTTQIDVSQLPAGMYFILIQLHDRSPVVKKLVKK